MGTVAGNAAESATAPRGAARGEVPDTCGRCARPAAGAGSRCRLGLGAAVAEEDCGMTTLCSWSAWLLGWLMLEVLL